MTSVLKVSEIQDPTNNNSAITINSSGFVTMPQNPKIYSIFRNTTNLTANGVITAWEVPDDAMAATNIGATFTHSSGLWQFPVTGVYKVVHTAGIRNTSGDSLTAAALWGTTDNGSNYHRLSYQACGAGSSNNEDGHLYGEVLVNISNTSTHKVEYRAESMGASSILYGHSGYNRTSISFEWMAPAQ